MMPMEPRLDFAILADRLRRLLLLDTSVFDEVRQDPAATLPAVFVVITSTVLAGIGGWLWWLTQGFPDGGQVLFESVVLGSIFSVALWIVWLLVAYVILTQIFREDADWQQMLRTMGMAAAPLSLSVLMFIPGISFGVGLASVALFFGLTTIAIQSTTAAGPAHVLIANLAGFAIWAIVLGLLVTSESFLAPGIFLIDSTSEQLSDIASLL
ncbi:MAG: hypothetical protein IIB87_03210 [Chloroflexi bacterium]|nr:hypothetical protein [Chloroflexota bacterium]